MKTISILGATGSIGVNTLDVIRHSPETLRVCALAGARNVALLAQQMEEFTPQLVAVLDDDHAASLKRIVGRRFRGDILAGEVGYADVARSAAADLVVAAQVGAAGLKPILAAIAAGKDVAIANKEILVMAGHIVMAMAKERRVRILPLDSEHSAIFQCLACQDASAVKRIVITASGGPFWRYSLAAMKRVTPESALKHPRWNMGKKVSVDSATMMNKGLELIEARWLFDVTPAMLEPLIHPQSIVHSLVEFCDGSLLAQLSAPDMRLPIAYALNFPQRSPREFARLDLGAGEALEFFPPDYRRFPCLGLAREVLHAGGLLPAVMNAANEIAVEAFLAGRVGFTQISTVIADTLEGFENKEAPSLEEVLAADVAARNKAKLLVEAGFPPRRPGAPRKVPRGTGDGETK